MSAAAPARLALIAASADRRTRDRADLRAAESWARTLTALLDLDRAPPRRAGRPRPPNRVAFTSTAITRQYRRTGRGARDVAGRFEPMCCVCRAAPDTEPARGAYRTPEGAWFCRWHWRRAVEAVG